MDSTPDEAAPTVHQVEEKYDFILQLGPLEGAVMSFGVLRGVLILTSPVFRRAIRKDAPPSGTLGDAQNLHYERTECGGVSALRLRAASMWADPAFLLQDGRETRESAQATLVQAAALALSLAHNRSKANPTVDINMVACSVAFARDFEILPVRFVEYFFHKTISWAPLVPEWEPAFHDPWLVAAFFLADNEVFETCAVGLARACSLNELEERKKLAPEPMKPYYDMIEYAGLRTVMKHWGNIATFYRQLAGGSGMHTCAVENCKETKAAIFAEAVESRLHEAGARILKDDKRDAEGNIEGGVLHTLSCLAIANVLKDASERIHAECLRLHGQNQTESKVAVPDCLKSFDSRLRANFEWDRSAIAEMLVTIEGDNKRPVPAEQYFGNPICTSMSNSQRKLLWKPTDQWLLKEKPFHLGRHSKERMYRSRYVCSYEGYAP